MRRDDGSVVYSGTVASGLIARETGFKEGQAIRVLPFGYVAHDEAANAQAPLDVAVTVGPEGVLRTIAVSWGTWTYTVSYSGLGSTPAPRAPKNARPFPRPAALIRRRAGPVSPDPARRHLSRPSASAARRSRAASSAR